MNRVNHQDLLIPRRVLITVCALWKDAAGIGGREKACLIMSMGAQELLGRRTGKAKIHPFQAGDDNFFVSDKIYDGRKEARRGVCEVFRKLQFIEATGLLPAQDFVAQRSLPGSPGGKQDKRSPFHHHMTFWAMPKNNRAVVLVERQFSPSQLKQDVRMPWADMLAWAAEHRCKGIPLSWTGAWNPTGGTRALAMIQNDASYDLENLRIQTATILDYKIPTDWN